jgi:hypothetical protein
MHRKSLQPYVVYAYGWTADGSAALPLVLLKTRELYQRTYGGSDPKYRPAPGNELIHAGPRRSETGYLAVLGNVETRISEMAAIPQTTGFLDMAVRRDFQLPEHMHVTLITRPGYINGPWEDRAEVYEASRSAARAEAQAREQQAREFWEQSRARDERGANAAQVLADAGYPAAYRQGRVTLDVEIAERLIRAARLGGVPEGTR